MVVNIAKKRELVARVLGVGANRIRFEPDRLEDVADSITRDNIRSLVNSGAIWTVQPRGTSRGRAIEKRSGDGCRAGCRQVSGFVFPLYEKLFRRAGGAVTQSLRVAARQH